MARLAAGGGSDPVVAAVCNSLSPLAWDERMLEGIKVFAQRGQAINISCCSMSGATAPIHLIGGVVQANCEVLGGLIYSQLVRPGAPIIYGTTSSVMDMSTMALALGTPEYSLISVACAQMAAHYGLPFRGGGGLTDAKALDAQSGLESTWNLLVTLNSGANFVLQAAGVLESFMAVGFDKWVFDEEIILRIQRLARGLGPWPEDLVETLLAGREAGGFMKLKSTLKNFREVLYRPTLGDRLGFESWRAKGVDLRREAWKKVRRRLEDYRVPDMDPVALAALRDLFRKRAGAEPPEAS
jgi:trimethylamine--corrinoid protein Co-methyltransferase